jgi:hypothetical protein
MTAGSSSLSLETAIAHRASPSDNFFSILLKNVQDRCERFDRNQKLVCGSDDPQALARSLREEVVSESER